MNFNYAEPIIRIASALSAADVPYKVRECNEGWQICFPWCKGDVACHPFTRNSSSGMVETYQFPWDDGETSVMFPSEAATKIITHYVMRG